MNIRWTTLLAAGLGLSATLPASAGSCTFSPEAQYSVRFEATWSSQTLPLQFPNSAHFSPLIGATHGDQVSFWAPGELASNGVAAVAETGSTSSMTFEVNTAVNNGTALSRVNGGAVNTSPGNVSTTFTVNTEHPQVTLITMIAPSPDWFVGVHGQSLFANGNWVESLTVPLFAYDSGTDSGSAFIAANQDTQPPEPISLLSGALVTVNGELVPFGDFVFTRLTDSCLDSDTDSVGDDVDNCTAVANTDQTDGNGDGFGNACDADLNDDCTVNVVDLGLLRSAFFSSDPVADLNADGVVNVVDLGLMRTAFFGPPGPSATASCGG
ncbi:MAG: spondin domain-containing protein [Gammaproteobacteria bacterium]